MPETPTIRSSYPHFLPIQTRWKDNDIYGHVGFLNLKTFVEPAYFGWPHSPFPHDVPGNFPQAAQAKEDNNRPLLAQISALESTQHRAVREAALNMAVAAARHDYQGAIMVTLSPGWMRTDMGGDGADLPVATSVKDLRSTLQRLGPADNGGFFNHDGAPLSW